jgi:hypothetical protein
MKAATILQLFLGLVVILLVAIPGLPLSALAQDGDSPEPAEKYSREELAQMLAPVALYPDALLSQVLMASTYPIEVIEADRWRQRNPKLQGEALDAALLDQGWDPSVKAICHFPSVLALMSERITQTTNIGNAFLAQEAEVMDMIQELRARAREQGNLTTTPEQKVIVEKQTIIIEPANPRVIYVPYYDAYTVYGPWWYPAYPPYYWGPPGISLGVGIRFWPGFYFGFIFGDWVSFDWHRHYIHYHVHKRPRFVRHGHWVTKPGPWRHSHWHRRGVAYRDKHTARKYGQHHDRYREYRPDTRGYPEGGGPERDRRDDDRRRIDRERPGGERPQVDRDRRERQRTDDERQMRERPEDGRQERLKREPPERQRVERERRERQQAEQQQQIREQTERGRQEQQRIDRDRQERQRAEQQQQQIRQQAERERQERQRVEEQRRAPERVERGQAVQRERPPDRGGDTIFNRVDNGRRERQSSERGQSSRQGRGGVSRGQGGWEDDDRGGRFDRGREDRNRSRR